jgi:cytosine/adenosine deaminase-related metal-dependent hydrolase
VAVRPDTPRTAGAAPEQLALAAGAADVDTVVVGGRVVVAGGRHRTLDPVGPALHREISRLWTG